MGNAVIVRAWIPGRSRTKGSLEVRGGYARDSEHSKRWRALVAQTLRTSLPAGHVPYGGPVAVTIGCVLPVTSLAAGDPDAALITRGSGDVDKLARNILDALSAPRADGSDARLCAGVIADDAQVCKLEIVKAHDTDGRGPGAWVQVAAMPMAEINGWRLVMRGMVLRLLGRSTS